MSRKASKSAACQICGKPRVQAFRPFCSKRCRNVDLARWIDGAYRVPVVETEPEDDDLPIPPSAPDADR